MFIDLFTIQHSIVNTIGRANVWNLGIDKHAISIAITKSGEVWSLV
jgi:hypothetical protein